MIRYSLFLFATMCLADEPLQITAVTDSANYKPGFPQRGSLASIFLTGLRGPSGVT